MMGKNKNIEVRNSEVLKFFFNESFLQKKFLFGALIFVIIGTGLSNIYPLITKNIIDLISTGNFLLIEGDIWKNFYYLFGIVFGMLIFWRLVDYFSTVLGLKVMKKIFSESFNYVNKHSYKFFSDNLSGSLIKKINRLPFAFYSFAELIFYTFLPAIISFFVLFYVLYLQTFELFLISLSFLLLIIFVTNYLQAWHLPYSKAWLKEDSKLGGLSADVITNNFNVSIFGAFGKEKDKFDSQIEIWGEKGSASWFRNIFIFAVQWGLIMAFELLVTYFILKEVLAGNMSVGTFVMIELYLLRLTPKFYAIGTFFKQLYRIFADASEALEILKTPHEITDIENAKNLEVKKGEIEFKNVDFKYQDGTEVFKKFNLKIKPGEKVALVGESGAGKTSITQLIFRFFDINSGEILIDGQDISKVKQDSLRKNISLVPQDPILFHRSLAENMKYGNEEISEEEFLEISKKTHCDDFISELENGYNSMVGERGIKLSGGQRQRVAIARAIIENSKIFILDEATSSLDSQSEKKIQEALEIAMEGKTSIVIAHRLSTIMKMDRIIVLNKGEIVEEGTHEELLKNGKKYKKFWEIQSGSFEK